MKSILTTIVFVGLVSSVQAQTSDNATATITANVIAALEITTNQNLSFGDVAQNTSNTVDVTDAGAAKFTINGEPNKNVTFTLTSPANLTSGVNNLPFSDDAQYNPTDDAAAASVLNNGATVALSGAGELYVYIGGTVTAGASQGTGAYSGNYVVQVDY